MVGGGLKKRVVGLNDGPDLFRIEDARIEQHRAVPLRALPELHVKPGLHSRRPAANS